MIQREDFKNLTKSIRVKFNWTQSEMAKMLGVTQAAVCKWEKRGSISLINYLKLQQLKDSSNSTSSFVNDFDLSANCGVSQEHNF
ncbi:helix-turn-helix transcriptional regulator [Bartonella sp. B12(2025)]